MRAIPNRDRLAVCTFEQAGEEIPNGDPSVTDAGAVPPVLLVGLHNAPGVLTSVSDLRAQEYLPGHNRRRFDAHLRFVTSEVLPWLRRAGSARWPGHGRGGFLQRRGLGHRRRAAAAGAGHAQPGGEGRGGGLGWRQAR